MSDLSRWRAIVDATADAVVVVGPNGHIESVNPAAERMFGRAAGDMVGRDVGFLMPSAIGAVHPVLMTRDRSGGSDVVGHAREVVALHRDGTEMTLHLSVGQFPGGDGPRYVGVLRELRPEESLARYRALARLIPGGAVYLFDASLRYLVAEGPAAHELAGGADPVGLTPAEALPSEVGARVMEHWRRALAGESQSHRATSPAGREYDLTVAPIDADGRIVGGIVVALDVTERTRLQAEQDALHQISRAVARGASPREVLEMVVEHVAALFGAVGAAVFRFTEPGVQTVVACRPAGDPEVSVGTRLPLVPTTAAGRAALSGEPVVVADYGEADDPLARVLRRLGAVGGVAVPIVIRQRIWGAIGMGCPVAERLTPETAARLGRFAQLVATSIDQVEAWEALSQEASTDVLTGLWNRRAFLARLGSEMARAARHPHALGLVMFDLDRFKRVNDRHGHTAGDRVLAAVARVVETTTRGEEMVARIGGEEFAIILPESDLAGSVAAAERVRAAVRTADFGDAGRITVSLGVAQARADDSAEDLMSRADAALYAAKAAGRDATRAWTVEGAGAVSPGRPPAAGA